MDVQGKAQKHDFCKIWGDFTVFVLPIRANFKMKSCKFAPNFANLWFFKQP